MRTPTASLATALVVTGVACACVAGAPASRAGTEREIEITGLHLGLTPGGRIGVYLAYTPRRPRSLSTVSVSVGSRPRMVFGFYKGGRTVPSPLRDVFPNASDLRAGRSYRVIVSFCRADATPRRAHASTDATARAAKIVCDRRSFVSRTAYLHRSFSPPSS